MDCKGGQMIKSEGLNCSEWENELKVELPRRVNWSKSEG